VAFLAAGSACSEQSDNNKNGENTSTKTKQSEGNKAMPKAANEPIAAIAPPVIQNISKKGAPQEKQNQESNNWADTARNVRGFLAENWDKVLASIFSGLLVWFTYLLWRSTHNLWTETKVAGETAKASIQLARDEFISTHRPRLIVRRVSIEIAKGKGNPDILYIQFVVANTGDTKATIIKMSARIWLPEISEGLPAIPPYEGIIYPNIALASGESHVMCHFDTDGLLSEFQHRTKLVDFGDADDRPPFHFIGYIKYEDELKRTRRTAFCRLYGFATKRFDPIPHPDYEYQD
jgi:hypothetical protein